MAWVSRCPLTNGGISTYYATTYYGCISPSYGQSTYYCYTHYGVKVPSCSGLVVEQLMKFLEVDRPPPTPTPTPAPTRTLPHPQPLTPPLILTKVDIDHVSAEAVLAMRDLLRKYAPPPASTTTTD